MNPIVKPMEYLIFWRRWLLAPLYLGLIVAQITIHGAFLLSAIAIAYTDKITMQTLTAAKH